MSAKLTGSGTGVETLVSAEGHRWAIEDSFEAAKTEFGLDHNETRSWRGWHRHVSLVMLAFAMMATIRHHANAPAASQTPSSSTHRRALSSVVDPGNPPHRHAPGPMTHPARSHHRLVALAKSAPGQRTTLAPET